MDGLFRLVVEDDGAGASEEEILMLMKEINGPLIEEMGCGLWNVNQRIKLSFGGRSGFTWRNRVSAG